MLVITALFFTSDASLFFTSDARYTTFDKFLSSTEPKSQLEVEPDLTPFTVQIVCMYYYKQQQWSECNMLPAKHTMKLVSPLVFQKPRWQSMNLKMHCSFVI